MSASTGETACAGLVWWCAVHGLARGGELLIAAVYLGHTLHLCRERDVHEAAAKAAQAQALLAGEAEAAAEERAGQLAAECQRLELAAASQQSEREQLVGELQGLAASEAAAHAELQAAAAAAAQQAAALSKAQHELEVVQAQLQARSVGSKDGRRHRWAGTAR